MKNFDNFDESIKQKMDGMNFQFNDANWEKMNEMIDASRPTKKPFGKLPLISSIVVGSALIVSSVWYMMSDSSSTKEVAVNTQAVVVETNSNVNDANIILNTNSNTKSTSDQNLNTNSNSSNNNNVQLVSDNSNSSSNSNAAITTVSTKNENKILANKTSTKKNTASKIKNTNGHKIVADLSASNDEQNVAANNNLKTPVGEKEGERLKTSGNAEVTINKSGNNESTTTSNNAGEEKNINEDNEEADLVTLPSLTTNLGQTADQIAAANLKTAVVEEKKAWEYVRVKHHTLSLEGGAINSFGWAVNKTRNGNNLSPVLGINYMYNFDSRSSLLIGLQYNSIANLGEAKANFSVTSYGFGVNNDVTTYKLMDLHYAVMPVKYIHRLNKNNALGFGLNMMYLMNTRTEITKTTMVESNVSTTSDKRFEMGYGFNQLNTFNSQIAVSFHHSISNKLALNAEINKALMNVVEDYKYFGAKNASSAPAAIKLSLTYTLFNK